MLFFGPSRNIPPSEEIYHQEQRVQVKKVLHSLFPPVKFLPKVGYSEKVEKTAQDHAPIRSILKKKIEYCENYADNLRSLCSMF